VVDPIDGTASFITGKPPVRGAAGAAAPGHASAGILEQPILEERWVGCQGAPTALNGRPVQVRQAASLASCYLYTTSPHLFPAPTASRAFEAVARGEARGLRLRLLRLRAPGAGLCGRGAGVWGEALGLPGACAHCGGRGGVMSDWRGQPLRLTSLDPAHWPSHILAAGCPAVHQEALQALAWDG